MLSSLLIITQEAVILAQKTFKHDVSRKSVQLYCQQVVRTGQFIHKPILLLQQTSFIAIPHKKLIFLATTKTNLNVAMVIQFLYKLISICKIYCSGELTEKSIMTNLSLIHEIIVQTIDYGCPQNTDLSLLRSCILEKKLTDQQLNRDHKFRILHCKCRSQQWRKQGVHHTKNQIYLIVNQNLSVVFSKQGYHLQSEVIGRVRLFTKLSGMPECMLGMNQKLLERNQNRNSCYLKNRRMGNIATFHNCVKFSKSGKYCSITFTPPEGQTQLISYQVRQNINCPFKILPIYSQIVYQSMEIRVKLISTFKSNLRAKYVKLLIKVPPNTQFVKLNNQIGKHYYEGHTGVIVWEIYRFQGEKQLTLSFQIEMKGQLSDKKWMDTPIKLQFEIPMFTASGLQFNFLRVYQKTGYKPAKFYKSVTKSANYVRKL